MLLHTVAARARRRCRSAAPVAVAGALALGASIPGFGPRAALAQDDIQVIDEVEHLDFDRPQAWAMKYFGTVSLFTPLGAPMVREPGSIDIALEATQVPHLSADERRVGFDGVKEEDLNRLPVLARPRLLIGLPHRFAIELGYVPPIEVDGIEPELFSLAIDRVLFVGPRWSMSARLHGQIGTIEGDLTCSEEDASHPVGSPENLYGCQAPSNDEASLDHIALHLGAGYQVGGSGGPTFLFGGDVIHHDLEFQVDALTYSVRDRSLLLASGTTWALEAGLAIPAGQRTEIGFEVLWSPLEVVRPPSTSSQTDELLHLKAAVRYRVK